MNRLLTRFSKPPTWLLLAIIALLGALLTLQLVFPGPSRVAYNQIAGKVVGPITNRVHFNNATIRYSEIDPTKTSEYVVTSDIYPVPYVANVPLGLPRGSITDGLATITNTPTLYTIPLDIRNYTSGSLAIGVSPGHNFSAIHAASVDSGPGLTIFGTGYRDTVDAGFVIETANLGIGNPAVTIHVILWTDPVDPRTK